MAHYAFLDNDNVVTHVIVGCDEDGVHDWELVYAQTVGQRCKRTSYNTRNNRHAGGGVPYRGNYAGVGYRYDDALDAFVPPKPYESWIFDETICDWIPPIARPDGAAWFWNETLGQWVDTL